MALGDNDISTTSVGAEIGQPSIDTVSGLVGYNALNKYSRYSPGVLGVDINKNVILTPPTSDYKLGDYRRYDHSAAAPAFQAIGTQNHNPGTTTRTITQPIAMNELNLAAISNNGINTSVTPWQYRIRANMYASSTDRANETNVLQTLGQLEKDAKFLKENYELHVNYLESYSDMTGTIQVNRVITAPMLYLTYMGSSGKDKIAFKATDTKLISRETKVRYYEIGGQLYEAPACFKNAELMKAVLGSNVRNGLVLVDLDGAGFVNGRFTFDNYGTIAASATPGRYDFTKGATAVDKEIYPYAEIKYLQFTDGTNKFIVPAGTDMAGDTLTMS